jgi:KipI family sensor histidine kinase inhibitor
MTASVRFLDSGDTALVVEFGAAIDPAVNERVLALDAALRAADVPGVVELTPTFRSLMIHYDPLRIDRAALVARTLDVESQTTVAARALRRWTIPCCYDQPHGEDLAEVAARLAVSPEQVVALHSQAVFRVYMYGFAPGFAYLGGLPDALAIPRRAQPRPPHPVNAILMAGGMSLIGTVPMPTGWWVIGRTPERMYAPGRAPEFLVSVGDEIRFDAVDAEAFNRLEARAAAGETLARAEAV